MQTGFQITSEGQVLVRNEGAIYADTLANFALDYGQSAPSLPGEATQMLYEPGKRCLYATSEGVIGGEELPWAAGDTIVAACADLLAAKAAREHVEEEVGVPSSITRRQLLLALMGAGLITSAEAIAAAQTGAVPAMISSVFDQLPEPDKTGAYITWASMSVAERNNPLVAMLATTQNMDEAAIDALFTTAATF